MSPRRFSWLTLLFGAGIAAWGRLAVDAPDVAQAWIAGHLGERGAAGFIWALRLLPGGAAVSISASALGSLLIAIAVGAPRELAAPSFAVAAPESSRPHLGGLVVLTTLAISAVACLMAFAPATWPFAPNLVIGPALATWAAAIAAGGIFAARADHLRGTWPWRRGFPGGGAIAVGLLCAATLAYVAHDLSHWRWAGVPDESYFYVAAQSVIDGTVRTSPFSENGVFGFHPLLSTYYQALCMLLFGRDVVGWRLSSALAFVATLPFVYLLMRELYSRRAALVAAVLTAGAQFAVGFAHLGYNNIQVYVPAIGGPACLLWAVRRRTLAGVFAGGVLVGLGFYTYYTARMGVLIAPLLLWSAASSRSSSVAGSAGRTRDGDLFRAALLGFLITALPAILQLPGWAAQVLRLVGATGGRLLGVSEFGGAVSRVIADGGWQIALHWLLSVFYGVWSESGLFQFAPVLDPYTAVLSLAGVWIGLGMIVRRRRTFLAPAYLGLAFAVGAVSNYPQPALTRLLMLVPFSAMLAAATLDAFAARVEEGRARSSVRSSPARVAGTAARSRLDVSSDDARAEDRVATTRHYTATGLVAMVVLLAVCWNIEALHDNITQRFHGFGDGRTAELIRLARRLPPETTIVHIGTGRRALAASVDTAMNAYGFADHLVVFTTLDETVEGRLRRLPPPVVVTYRLDDIEERRIVERALSARFPGYLWKNTDATKPWNLRYFYVP